MPSLHDSAYRTTLKQRLDRVTPQTQPKWGRMSPDQVLWHLNCSLENPLGRFSVATIKMPIPRPILRFLTLSMPWGKGAPTAPEFRARETFDFAAERKKLSALLEEFAAKDPKGTWPDSPFLGPLTGDEWSRLMAKHVDHHLKQLGT